MFIPPPVFIAPAGGDPVGISWRCLMLTKLEGLGYRTVKKLWQYVKQFSSNTGMSRTNGRVDRRTEVKLLLYQYRASELSYIRSTSNNVLYCLICCSYLWKQFAACCKTILVINLPKVSDDATSETTQQFTSLAVFVDFIDHVHEFLFGRILTQTPHNHSELFAVDVSAVVLVEQLERLANFYQSQWKLLNSYHTYNSHDGTVLESQPMHRPNSTHFCFIYIRYFIQI